VKTGEYRFPDVFVDGTVFPLIKPLGVSSQRGGGRKAFKRRGFAQKLQVFLLQTQIIKIHSQDDEGIVRGFP
jgi:hypothetical protein